MALNPELVVKILQAELPEKCIGNWLQNSQILLLIQQRAIERATSPTSFVGWLILQQFFQLKTEYDTYDFEKNLKIKIAAADQTVIPETIRTAAHDILYIESDAPQVALFQQLLKRFAKREYGVLASQIQFEHISYPPEDETAFAHLLNKHTGALLHNLSLDDLIVISKTVLANPVLASKLVVVMTGSSSTAEHERLHSLLKSQGLMVINKPFPSFEEVVRVLLGVV